MQFITDKNTHEVPDSYLLVGLDETGHELISSHHPVFGIGGCAIPVRDYESVVRTPWQMLKRKHFGVAEDVPLHAVEVSRNITAEQAMALGDFFDSGSFGRIAALVTTETNLADDIPPYKIVAYEVLEKMARLTKRFGCNGVVFVIEESRRTDRLAAAYFGGYYLHPASSYDGPPLDLLQLRMPKAAAEPLLEVADFVAHTARHQVFRHLHGTAWGTLKDYQAVFGIADKTLVEFVEILAAQ